MVGSSASSPSSDAEPLVEHGDVDDPVRLDLCRPAPVEDGRQRRADRERRSAIGVEARELGRGSKRVRRAAHDTQGTERSRGVALERGVSPNSRTSSSSESASRELAPTWWMPTRPPMSAVSAETIPPRRSSGRRAAGWPCPRSWLHPGLSRRDRDDPRGGCGHLLDDGLWRRRLARLQLDVLLDVDDLWRRSRDRDDCRGRHGARGMPAPASR